MRDGHIDNFLIPCFCRKLFEDNHPTKSGRHYFFSYVGVCICTYLSYTSLFVWPFLISVVHSLFQESILELSSTMHENIVRTYFLGAASASKGKRLENSEKVGRVCKFFVQISVDCICVA
jgi:hypothetical protein